MPVARGSREKFHKFPALPVGILQNPTFSSSASAPRRYRPSARAASSRFEARGANTLAAPHMKFAAARHPRRSASLQWRLRMPRSIGRWGSRRTEASTRKGRRDWRTSAQSRSTAGAGRD